jgi:hypothetical protein
MKNWLIFGMLVCIVLACHSSDKVQEDKFNQYIERLALKIDPLNKRSVYFVATFGSCSPCLKKTIDFVGQHSQNLNVRLIIAEKSQKAIKYNVKDEMLRSGQVVVDREMLAEKMRIVAIEDGLITVFFFNSGQFFKSEKLNLNDLDGQFQEISNFLTE